jgi:hypothetical protein
MGGVDISSGPKATIREDLAGNKESAIHGKTVQSIGGTASTKIDASRDTLIGKNDLLAVGHSLKETVGHDREVLVSNQLRTTVEGGITAIPGNVAILWEAVNGSIESVAGNPKLFASPAGRQTHSFVNYAGDFNIALQSTAPAAKFNLISTMPDSVLLGASGTAVPGVGGHTFTATASEHAMKYEPFAQMMETLLMWLDKHTHLTAMGPSGPAELGTFGPITPQIKPSVPLIKSIRVCIGL